jgi:hypothetical protein
MTDAELHHWTVADRQWVCAAPDHGPLCRRCIDITDNTVALGILDNYTAGHITFEGATDNTDIDTYRWKLTPQGNERAGKIIQRLTANERDN